MAYDVSSGQLIMFGGNTGAPVQRDVDLDGLQLGAASSGDEPAGGSEHGDGL